MEGGGGRKYPPGTKILGVGGMNIFLEPHIKCSKCFIAQGLIQKENERELVHLSPVLLINIIFSG